jgi:hypothetical protein
MLDIVCWKWKPAARYRSQFGPETVNVLQRMVARHLRLPYRFSCITDDATGIDPSVRIIPLWSTYGGLINPSGAHNPSCYRRLRMFSSEARELIGERIVSLDLDVVITGDITSVFDRDEDFIIWGGQSVQPGTKVPFCWYNGSTMMLRAGTRLKVWDEFDPQVSPMRAHRANSRGSDQGWISYCLGPGERIWTDRDGLYSFRNQVATRRGGRLPADARMIMFHGKVDPWSPEAVKISPWIKEHYQ